MLDDTHLMELQLVSSGLSNDNVGDAMQRAMLLKATLVSPVNQVKADEIIETIRHYARSADIGWRVFEQQIELPKKLTEENIWQLIGIMGALFDLNYCFERIEEARIFTFENSAPVRFYWNGIFHYITALFLLDKIDNLKMGLPHAGTVIKVLHPIGLGTLLDPLYQVFDRSFGVTKSYGDTILRNRNRQFVHGSFSPKNVRSLVKDTNIFDESQRLRFMQFHKDLYDRLIVFRLQIISILSRHVINPSDFSPSKIFRL